MTRMLVIPGLGDIHWVALKLESFIARHCPGERPEVWIWNFDERPRSAEFVQRLPFVRFGGYWNQPINVARDTFHQAYMTGEVDAVRDFCGFDWFLCVNGSLRVGRGMGDILPECTLNWDYPIEHRDGDEVLAATLPEPFVLAYFSDHGMFTHWLRHVGPPQIADLLRRIDATVVLTGSAWDCEFARRIEGANTINLAGRTSFAELMGLIRRCRAFVGWCGGNTILASHLGVPTYMLWSDYFKHRAFQTNWANPRTINTTYRPADVERFDAEAVGAWINQWTGNLQTI